MHSVQVSRSHSFQSCGKYKIKAKRVKQIKKKMLYSELSCKNMASALGLVGDMAII